jgi:hypothetical protein
VLYQWNSIKVAAVLWLNDRTKPFMPTSGTKLFLILILAALINACASVPGPDAEQNVLAETDDLAMITDEALQLADLFGPQHVLVVYDIDNTLLAMEQGLGSDQWYYWQKALSVENPCSNLLAGDRFKVQGALYFASAMRPTQADVALQVRRLQDAGLPVIALTSRGPEFSLQTFRELRRNGISFWPSALPPARGFPEPFIPEGGQLATLYQDGVFLTAGQHKGAMLKALLDKSGVAAPTVIVIADDKPENLQTVMETFEGSGTLVHAWRYSREDANVAALDTREATAQWDAARPALMTIEAVFGPDNFELPARTIPEGCN